MGMIWEDWGDLSAAVAVNVSIWYSLLLLSSTVSVSMYTDVVVPAIA